MQWPFRFRLRRSLDLDDRLDDELTRLGGRRGGIGYLSFMAGFALLAFLEWYGYVFGLPRYPEVFTLLVIAFAISAGLQLRRFYGTSRGGNPAKHALRERSIEQMLDSLRANGAQVVSAIPGDGFELVHVAVSDRGIVVVQPHLLEKPDRDGAKISFHGEQVLIAGRVPSADPIRQMRAQIGWLSNLLQQLTGDRYPVRGAIVFPGWWVDPTPVAIRKEMWVLEPRALPAFVSREPVRLSVPEIHMALGRLRHYTRSRALQ